MNIIAELCQNHNGSFDVVKRMVDSAVSAGATHVKLQAIYARNLVFRTQFETGLERDGSVLAIKRPWQAEYDRLKGLELTPDHCADFVNYCRQAGVVPLTTCFSRGDIPEIKAQGFSTVKVASYDCASYTLLRELAANFDSLIVSTGATFDNEVDYAAKVLQSTHTPYTFLHCVTLYPTPLEEMHLDRLNWLRQLSPTVGFSDHSLVERDGVVAAKAAIALGADVIERHFTILDPQASKDGPVSITASHLKEIAEFASRPQPEQLEILDREHPGWQKMKGSARRALSTAELLNRDYYRGRFATPRWTGAHRDSTMIFNWEETPL